MSKILAPADLEIIINLAEKLAGWDRKAIEGQRIIFDRLEQRILALGFDNLKSYLKFAKLNESEFEVLIHSLVNNTTFWFREFKHFEYLLEQAELFFDKFGSSQIFRVWSAACSTGEEAYSILLCLLQFQGNNPDFKFEIVATDLDPIAIQVAKRAKYRVKDFEHLPNRYQNLLSARRSGNLLLFENIKNNNIHFHEHSILAEHPNLETQNIIFCRNVLIYFATPQIREVITKLIKKLKTGGSLILGQSDAFDHDHLPIELKGNSVYQVKTKQFAKNTLPLHELNRTFNETGCEYSAILIGASTGGPEVLKKLLKDWPKDSPPVIVVQHIEERFLLPFSQEIANISGLRLGNSKNGGSLQNGSIYLPTGLDRFGVQSIKNQSLSLSIKPQIEESHFPCIDHLFLTASQTDFKFIAALLTGMGQDGANGLLKLKESGSFTIAQDKQSSIVYGMPKVATEKGAVLYSGNIFSIRSKIELLLKRNAA